MDEIIHILHFQMLSVMKNRNLIYPFLVIIIGTCWLISCGIEEQELPADQLKSAAEIPSELPPDCSFITISSIELTQVEKDMILFVREEEKMARDVYNVLADKFNKPIFKNIAKSEQVHMDKVWCLLYHFNLEDPILGPGLFANEEIQELYYDLIDLGSGPITDALTAGAIIEDFDIKDINERMLLTQNESILTVFENIVCGSGNHLVEFVQKLETFDIEYEPGYISLEDYLAILAAGHQSCGQ